MPTGYPISMLGGMNFPIWDKRAWPKGREEYIKGLYEEARAREMKDSEAEKTAQQQRDLALRREQAALDQAAREHAVKLQQDAINMQRERARRGFELDLLGQTNPTTGEPWRKVDAMNKADMMMSMSDAANPMQDLSAYQRMSGALPYQQSIGSHLGGADLMNAATAEGMATARAPYGRVLGELGVTGDIAKQRAGIATANLLEDKPMLGFQGAYSADVRNQPQAKGKELQKLFEQESAPPPVIPNFRNTNTAPAKIAPSPGAAAAQSNPLKVSYDLNVPAISNLATELFKLFGGKVDQGAK